MLRLYWLQMLNHKVNSNFVEILQNCTRYENVCSNKFAENSNRNLCNSATRRISACIANVWIVEGGAISEFWCTLYTMANSSWAIISGSIFGWNQTLAYLCTTSLRKQFMKMKKVNLHRKRYVSGKAFRAVPFACFRFEMQLHNDEYSLQSYTLYIAVMV